VTLDPGDNGGQWLTSRLIPDVDAHRRRRVDGHGADGGHVHVQEGPVGVALQQKDEVTISKWDVTCCHMLSHVVIC
jgi:hypothetical protein